MKKLIQILWKLFLFSFPFSLHWVWYEAASYRFGNFNPWVTGFMFLPEVFLFIIFVLYWFFYSKRDAKSCVSTSVLVLFFLFLLNAGMVTFFHGDMRLYAFFVMHILFGFLFYRLLRDEVVPFSESLRWLLFGALFQVCLVLGQVLLNHSVGLSFLGEPHVGPQVMNVAKNKTEVEAVIRGYGTFLHPNILAAYLMTIFLVAIPHLKKAAFLLWSFILLFGIYLTGSQAAELTLGVVLVLYLFFRMVKFASSQKVVMFGFLAIFFTLNAWFFFNADQLKSDDVSIQERVAQTELSRSLMSQYPTGVGIAQFTLVTEEVSPTKLEPWQYQPVHNVYFLVLSELGVQGLILLLMTIVAMLASAKNPLQTLPLLALVTIAAFDHLLMTSYVGFFLIAIGVFLLAKKHV